MNKVEALMDKILKLPNTPDIQTKAYKISQQIIALKPNKPDYYCNHALLCFDFGFWEEGIDALQYAKSLLPECPIIRRILSGNLFQVGRFREGFEEFEWRFKTPLPESPKSFYSPAFEAPPKLLKWYNRPYWDGKADISDKTVMAFNEGGYGDIIQTIRYLPQLKSRCRKVILEVKKEVTSLLKTAEGVDDVIEYAQNTDRLFFFNKRNPKYNDADYVVSLFSLISYFDSGLDNTPSSFPYLVAQPSNCEAIDIVKSCPAKLKIGITWAGNKGHDNDYRRSCFKRDMLPLAKIPGVQLFGLQKGDMDRNWQFYGKINLLDGGDVLQSIDLGDLLHDFNDTANVLKELNALVTVDTSIVHLAGALNVPVWLALPDRLAAEWRWQRKWYASLTAMRQQKPNDWSELFTRIASDICMKV